MYIYLLSELTTGKARLHATTTLIWILSTPESIELVTINKP